MMIFALLLLAQTPTEDGYAYSPIGKADPFRPQLPARVLIKNPKPLQRFDLEQLKLIAVVGGHAAMLEDPRGKGHTVRRGDFVGKNFGRVVAIRDRSIEIEEKTFDYLGRKVVTKHTLTIPKLPVATEDEEEVVTQP